MKGDKNYDYTDEFSDIIHTERFISAVELSELFFSAPKWITLLMKFRNVVMRPFGLKKKKKVIGFGAYRIREYGDGMQK